MIITSLHYFRCLVRCHLKHFGLGFHALHDLLWLLGLFIIDLFVSSPYHDRLLPSILFKLLLFELFLSFCKPSSLLFLLVIQQLHPFEPIFLSSLLLVTSGLSQSVIPNIPFIIFYYRREMKGITFSLIFFIKVVVTQGLKLFRLKGINTRRLLIFLVPWISILLQFRCWTLKWRVRYN